MKKAAQLTSLLALFALIIMLPPQALTAHGGSMPAVPHTGRRGICRADTLSPDTLARTARADTLALQPDSLSPGLEADSLVPLPLRLSRLLQDDIFERTQVGLYVYDLTADTLVMAYHERQSMRPASCQKLLTAVTALHTLGTGYRLRTRLYLAPPAEADAAEADADTADTASNADTAAADADAAGADTVYRSPIYIRGGFDPLFDSEDMRALTAPLRAMGIRRIEGPVIVDLTFKDTARLGWGWCWDDDNTPLTPLLYDGQDTFLSHLRAQLSADSIAWDGTAQSGTVPRGARLAAERTHTIDQLLLPMMKQSDNLMAEALFYQLAAHTGRPHASRRQAVRQYDSLITLLGLTPSHYQVADGSGLSLYNYTTPQLLGHLLRYAYTHPDIYRHLLPALPVAAVDGTLRRRMHGTPAASNVSAKTGTLEGVSTLAGYLTAASGNRLCFVIMNQGMRYGRTARRFQDRVCHALTR